MVPLHVEALLGTFLCGLSYPEFPLLLFRVV